MTLSDPGYLIVSIFLAVPLSWFATWLLAARYRATMKRLMSARAPPPGLAIAGTPARSRARVVALTDAQTKLPRNRPRLAHRMGTSSGRRPGNTAGSECCRRCSTQ
jgi:hypothetical protein